MCRDCDEGRPDLALHGPTRVNSPLDLRVAFAMPNRWTFQMPPVAEFVARWTAGRSCVVDPFCGTATVAHYGNDLGRDGVDAELFVRRLIR